MKKFTSTIVTVIIYFTAISQTLSVKLDDYFSAAQKAGIFNGSVLVKKGSDVLLKKGYGFRDVEAKQQNNGNTIFQIGSVTKQFTSAVILKLQEQGKLSINDKLSKYFPDFPKADSIILENLLSHTSGIYNYTNDKNFMQNEVEKTLTRSRFIEMIKDKPLDFSPGTKYRYSNSGYMFLGYIIEDVTGKKYEHVVRDMIFKPLGMTNTGYDFTHLKTTDKAIGYNMISETTGAKAQIVDSTVSFAAGAIYSTLSDIDKWNQSLSTEKILKRSSIENGFTPRLAKYGLGWGADSIDGRRKISHNGGIHGFLSHNTIIPADNITFTLLSNSGTTQLGKVSGDVLSILYNKPYTLPEVNKEVKLDAAILQRYVGEYELNPGFKISIFVVDGALKTQATGQAPFDLFAKSENVFFAKITSLEVEFVRNDKGEVQSMILHQGGQHIPGKKIK